MCQSAPKAVLDQLRTARHTWRVRGREEWPNLLVGFPSPDGNGPFNARDDNTRSLQNPGRFTDDWVKTRG